MEFGIYAIKDRLTGRFMQPIFIETKEAAERWFKGVVQKTEIFKDNPQDYELYYLGLFDDTFGISQFESGAELITSGDKIIRERGSLNETAENL